MKAAAFFWCDQGELKCLDCQSMAKNTQVVELDLPKGQLAARLGTILEALSRIFAKLSRDGLIEVEGNKARLLDLERLNQLAIGK